MPRCINALIHFRKNDATTPALALTFFLATFLAVPVFAQNPVLRDVEVRSFLGEPLNLRISLAASTEPNVGALCQSVIDNDGRENALRSADLVLTLVELRQARYLQVRSRTAFNDPIARFSLRIGCPGEPPVDREFTVLLDPPPFVTLPASASAIVPDASGGAPVPAKQAKSTARAKPVIPASGSASTVEGDTLAKLAKSIHPKNRARQRQYIEALRELNPPLAPVADDAPLASGTQLALPDLHTLSGILPSPAPRKVATASSSVPVSAMPAPAKKTPAIVKPAQSPKVDVAAAKPAAPPAPAKLPEQKAALPSPPKESVKPAPAASAEVRGGGFQLRLSGSQMDLTRSRNVTDEQRNILREKQLMLDSDDQVAAFLSLKNTVKQLEQRLNEIQLKTSTTTSVPATVAAAPSPPPAPAIVAPPTPAPSAKPIETAPPPAAKPAAVPPAATEKVSPPVEKPAMVNKPDAAVPADSSSFDFTSYLPSPLAGGAIAAVLIVLLGAWAWSRREPAPRIRSNSILDDAEDAEATLRTKRTKAAEESAAEEKVYDLEDEDAEFAEHAGHDEATVRIQSDPSWTDGHDDAAAQPAFDHDHPAHNQVDAPVIFEDTPASFEVDSSPATTVDFLVGMDEKLPEDRVRRLKYMHGRYPELQTNTVSIDDADSVINAARLYYDESDKGSGADKACELLTFAVEERPQQVRYWLAQFEIFRLENRVSDFSALASKFHVLFSHTPSWPKVRHIGHELDPGNTLFAGGSTPLAGEMRFDPIAENWLNAPVDFTSDALMSDLRQALLDDYHVSRTDFESITARLTASAA